MAKTKSIIEEATKSNIPSKEDQAAKIFNDDPNAPIVKSVGYCKIPNSNLYLSFIIHTQGANVIKVEVEEPNLRPIIEESAKLNFVNIFMNQDL